MQALDAIGTSEKLQGKLQELAAPKPRD